MKFAVVEYSSKSGTVWRHRDERPNFLCDPATEIDPTSFGGYVSALKGEHVPLKGLITGPVVPRSVPAQFVQKVVKRLTGSWLPYSLSYLQQFDAMLVVHQLSDSHELVRMLTRLRSRSPRPVLVGVATQPYGILTEALERDTTARAQFQAFMDACDVYLSVARETTPWYTTQSATPVVYAPQPYPVAFAQQFAQPLAAKERVILVAGVTQRAQIAQGQRVAAALQRRHPDYAIVVPMVAGQSYDATALAGTRYTMMPFEAWREHLQTLARVRLVINTDYTSTRGRVQVDCAAVGTVSLGSDSDAAVDLFPTLASTPTTSDETLVARGDRLLTDDAYYQHLVTTAKHFLPAYSYEQAADRFETIVREYRSTPL